MEEIKISLMERLSGDRGSYCRGTVGRLSFTAAIGRPEQDEGGWQIGLMGGAVVGSEAFKGKQLQERRDLAHKIREHLNKNYPKGGEDMSVSLKQLQDAAEDINKVFGLDDPIDIVDDKTKLTDEIRIRTMNPGGEKDSGMIRKDIDGDDHLRKETIKTLVLAEAVPEDLVPLAKTVAGFKEEKKKEPEKEKTNEKGGKPVAKKKTTVKKKTVAKKPAVKSKPAVKKPVTEKTSTKKVKGGIGAFVTEGLKKGTFKKKSNEEIAEITRKKFGSKTTASSIAWYKNKLK